MTPEDYKFLADIRAKCKDPVWVERIIHAAVMGITQHAIDTRHFAVDMESLAAIALNNRLFKGNEKFIADKLETWKHMSGLDWSEHLEKLKGKK